MGKRLYEIKLERYEQNKQLESITQKLKKSCSKRSLADTIKEVDDLPKYLTIEDKVDYRLIVIKHENRGDNRAYTVMYAKQCEKSISTVNFLFRITDISYIEAMNKFLDVFKELSKKHFIKNKKWCAKRIKLDFYGEGCWRYDNE